MNEYRHYCITRPGTARARKELAQLYRLHRKERPEMARLLWQRCRAAERFLRERVGRAYN